MGASGSIMGLIGALLCTALVGWRRGKAPIARKQAQTFIALIALQTLFDLMTPAVSMSAHLSGMSIGFLLALVLGRPKTFATFSVECNPTRRQRRLIQ